MTLHILFFALGVLSWTFLEYVIHRFWGHTRKKKPLNPFTGEHRRHHAEFDYFAATWKKLMAAILVLTSVTLLIGFPLGWLNGFAFASGLAGMYLVYEAIHWLAHHSAPVNAYGRWFRMHHFYHHFRSPKSNHGVTSPIWDMVFGTYVPVDEVVVPSRGTPLRWLFNEQGRIKPQFAEDYRLAGQKRQAPAPVIGSEALA